MSASTIVEAVDGLIEEERLSAARAAIADALEAADRTTRWRLELRRAEVGGLDEEQGEPIDEALMLLDDLLAPGRAGRHEPEVPRAHAERVRGFALKRCEALAAAAATDAGPLAERDPWVLLARGDAALFQDDRQAAGERYHEAVAAAPALAEARLALANLHYVLGDFTTCLGELEHVAREAAAWGRAQRLRAACYSTTGDLAREAEAWRALIDAYPQGDRRQDDRMALALALAMDGRRVEAFEVFRAVWEAEPESPRGAYARRRMELLEGAAPDARRRRLAAFPTTAQKWNTCGPAVLELCLRHLGLELSQDEIASVVMRDDHGTPMYALAGYLEALGIDARRIEATPPRLRAAIDLGLPVIVQEEYSTTSHVAVIVGYDESLGVFVSQDPATRRPIFKSFEWTRSAGDLFGNGGLIVLGRPSPELEALRARATAAGLDAAPHLSLLDACDRRRPGALDGEPTEGVADAEVVRLCDEAIARSPGFKLAHHRRFRALLGDDPDRALEELHRIRTTFVDDEWPRRLHASWLLRCCDRPDEAFAEFAEACRRDPADAHSRADMGECKWLAGDLARAERELLGAIAHEPHHVRAVENLAAVYLRQLEELDQASNEPVFDGEDDDEEDEGLDDEAADAAGEGEGDEGDQGDRRVRSMPPEQVYTRIARPRAEVLRRALHFSRVACDAHAENPFNHAVAAELHARRGEWEAAAAAYGRSRELDPGRPSSLWGLAVVLERLERHAEAEALYEEALKTFPDAPPSYEKASRFLARRDRLEEAAQVLIRGAEALDMDRRQLVPALVSAFEALEPGRGAARRLVSLSERWSGDAEFMRAVAGALEERRWRDEAIALSRRLVEAAPHDAGSLNRLGELLVQEPGTREEGRGLLQRVVELAPIAPSPRCALAWLALEDGEPSTGLALLEEVSEVEDSRVHETRAALLEALGRDEEAAAALRLALESEGEPEVGLLRLCSWHRRAQRPQRVYALVGKLPDLELEGPLALWAGSQWEEETRDLQECLALFEGRPTETRVVWRAWAGSLVGELWSLLGAESAAIAEHDEAVVGHEALLEHGPVCQRALADALGKRVEALKGLGRPVDALRDLARAAELQAALLETDERRRGDLAATHLDRSHALRALKDEAGALAALEEACAVCEAAPEDVPDEVAGELRVAHAAALRARARARAREDKAGAEADARAALALLEAASDEDPESLLAMADAALTCAGLLEGRLALDEARATLERAGARLAAATAEGEEGLTEASTEVGLRLVNVLCDAGRTAEARDACLGLIASLEAADEQDTEALCRAYHSLGIMSLDLLSDVPGSVEAYSKVLELGGEDLGTYSNRGYAYLRGYHPERALTDGDRVLKRLADREPSPGAALEEAMALRNIACAHEQLEDVPAAVEACARALELLQGAERRQTEGHLAEMQAVWGRLLLARGDAAAAVAVTDQAVATLSREVEGGHGQGEMDLVKALVANGAARHAVGDADGALEALARADEVTAKWVGGGGAFHDVLSDIGVRRARLLLDCGHGAAADEAAAVAFEPIASAIEAGFDYMIPELLRLAAEWLDARPDQATPTLARVARAAAAAPREETITRPVLRARRRDQLLAVLERHGLREEVDVTVIEALE